MLNVSRELLSSSVTTFYSFIKVKITFLKFPPNFLFLFLLYIISW